MKNVNVTFTKQFNAALNSFVSADTARNKSAMELARLISEEIISPLTLEVWRKEIKEVAKTKGHMAWEQAYRYPEKLAIEHFGWENPSQKHKSKESDGRKRKPPVAKTADEKTPIETRIKQALANAILGLSDSDVLLLISKDNRIKASIDPNLRGKFNKALSSVFNT